MVSVWLRLCSVPAVFRFLLKCLVDYSIFAVLHVKHSVKVPHSSIVFALDPHDVGAFSFSKVGLKSEIYSALHSTVPCILQLKFAFYSALHSKVHSKVQHQSATPILQK